jgi:hypothetical protein
MYVQMCSFGQPYIYTLLQAIPFLDIAMMCLELLGGSVVVHAKSSVTKGVMSFQNFLLQVCQHKARVCIYTHTNAHAHILMHTHIH